MENMETMIGKTSVEQGQKLPSSVTLPPKSYIGDKSEWRGNFLAAVTDYPRPTIGSLPHRKEAVK